jgi:protocatechuate 3,4-dioxygenase beta subunit
MKEVFPELTEDVIDRMDSATPRLREVMTLLIRHMHSFVREAALTLDEWLTGIEFLTRTGQICSDSRQEFILLSDILGVSMLVDAIAHYSGEGITDSTVLGPFYTGRQRDLNKGDSILLREEGGEALLMKGRVADAGGKPIAGAKVEVWQTATNELYDVQDPDQPRGHLRGTFRTDEHGEYEFRTVLPVSYPIPNDGPAGQLLRGLGRHPFRPAHVHFMISAPGHRKHVTHLFLKGDKYLGSDAVFGVKPSLIVRPIMQDKTLTVTYDFGLARVQES